MFTHSQLLLQALDLGLKCVNVLRLPLIWCVACVRQLRQPIQRLLQSLHICQQLRDLNTRKHSLYISLSYNNINWGKGIVQNDNF